MYGNSWNIGEVYKLGNIGYVEYLYVIYAPDLGDTRDTIHLILLPYMWNIGVLGNIGYRN